MIRPNMSTGGKVLERLLVISGPSGAGKGTLVRLLMSRHDSLGFSISTTSRCPRKGETDGVEYDFVSKEVFMRSIEERKFLEYAKVHGNYYGTTIPRVSEVHHKGNICVLEIDLQGAMQVMATPEGKGANYVFIAPPNLQVLEDRLRARGTEDEKNVKLRIGNAAHEMETAKTIRFGKVIINSDLDLAADELNAYVEACYPPLKQKQSYSNYNGLQ